MSYIIAWGGHLDAIDTKGLTPLHLACKSYKDIRSTKGIKQLLIKGANRNTIDFEGKKPIDYVPLPQDVKLNPKDLALEINRLLKEEWSLLGDCLMIRTSFRKQEKKPLTLIAYFILMVTTYIMQKFSTHKIMQFTQQNDLLLKFSKSLFFISMAMWLIVWKKDPGFLQRDKKLDFVEMLENFEASSLCPDCEVIRTPRCRHCTLCKRCVDRFDHHCPWVNNCIGKGNFAYFYLFLMTQSLYLLSVVALSGYCK